jgi:DNA-binding CsgD family transcriptional regulator
VTVLLCTWDAHAPGRAASGVSDDAAAAERAARTWLRDNRGQRARLELVTLGLGAGSLAGAYVRTGTAWQIVLSADNVLRVKPMPRGRPWRYRKEQRPEGLSPREREVAGLAAEGLTNRQIARQLGISERTVNTHLHAAYVKTRTGGRALLAGWIARQEARERGGAA